MKKPVTRLSTKGQIVLPKEIRERRRWKSGMRLVVEETAEGVLLKPEDLFAPAALEDVFGCLKDKYQGPPLTLEEMEEALTAEARRHARD